MKRKPLRPADGETPDFEQSLRQLQDAVRELESGELSLTESLARYESGVGHLRTCLRLLEETEFRIRQLVDVDKDGRAVLKPFEHERSGNDQADSVTAKRAVRKKAVAGDMWPDEDEELGGEG
jgi:exodeoxyribonuclease VII small subunit